MVKIRNRRHSPAVCASILKVVDACFKENLEEEIALTEKETGSRHISVSFDMGWQRKGTGHTYDSNSGHAYFIGCRSGKCVRYIVCIQRNARDVILQWQWAKTQSSIKISPAITKQDQARKWK